MINNTTFILFLFSLNAFTQTTDWKGYFSYNNVVDVYTDSGLIYGACDNAIFTNNIDTNEIKTITTVDGLAGQTISALYHDIDNDKTIIGYETGLIIVIDNTSGEIHKVVDIENKTITSLSKKINQFAKGNGWIYISTDFGIVQFNSNTLLFGDSYFIGDFGAEMVVNQTAIFNGYLYAATATGLKRALLANSNINDYNQWSQVVTSYMSGVTIINDRVITADNGGAIYHYNDITSGLSLVDNLSQAVKDFRLSDNHLIVTTAQNCYVYDSDLTRIAQVNNNSIPEIPSFSCATVFENMLSIGTTANGLYNMTLNDLSTITNETPAGPLRNNIFKIDVGTSALWAVYGDYTFTYNPYPLDALGISRFSFENGWLNIPYSDVLGALSISNVVINPNNESEVYASSFFSGLLKIENDVPTILYNQNNSGVESLVLPGAPNYVDIRVNAGTFDSQGNLWLGNGLVENAIKVLKPDGNWNSYNVTSVLNNYEYSYYAPIVVDDFGTKWIPTSEEGLLAFSETTNTFKKITTDTTGNLPSGNVRSVAIDNNNQVWIGTAKGLRVITNVASFKTADEISSRAIIIIDDGLAQELMFEQIITAITVDGANYKWIGTTDSGIFYVSPDGQTTKYHFTTSNSPLPSNNINDININKSTGEVFIVTDKGMVSFKGIPTQANENLNDVYIYPNPVRPNYTGTVKIAGLIDNANVKITDIQGNLVYETTTEGGTIEWDTTAFSSYRVASGVYMVFIVNQDGTETKVKKLMIVR
jgi:hypothetical protein